MELSGFLPDGDWRLAFWADKVRGKQAAFAFQSAVAHNETHNKKERHKDKVKHWNQNAKNCNQPAKKHFLNSAGNPFRAVSKFDSDGFHSRGLVIDSGRKLKLALLHCVLRDELFFQPPSRKKIFVKPIWPRDLQLKKRASGKESLHGNR